MIKTTARASAIFTVEERAVPLEGDLHRRYFGGESGREVGAGYTRAKADVFAVAFVAYCVAEGQVGYDAFLRGVVVGEGGIGWCWCWCGGCQ